MPGTEAGSIYATAELDISKFSSGAAKLDSETAKIAASMQKAAAGLDLAQANLNDLAAGLDVAKARMDSAEAAFNKSAQTLEEMQIRAEEAAIHAAELGNAYEQAAAKFGEGSAAAYIAGQAYDEAAASADTLYDSVEAQEKVVKKNEAAFKKAAAAVRKYESKIGAAEGKVESLTDELTGLNAQLESAASPELAELTDATAESFGAFRDVLGEMSGKTLASASRSLSTLATRMMGLNTSSTAGILVSKGLNTVMTKAAASIGGVSLGTAALGAGAIAAAAGAAYLYREYVIGAKAAREAQEKLNETAKEWQDNNVVTSYEKSQGLQGYGISAADFKPTREAVESAVDDIIKTWTDGLVETNEIVNTSIAAFTAGTESVRSGIESYRESASAAGLGEALDADIAKLDAMDAEVEKLLKKRRNGNLTDEEIARLYKLQIDRESLAIKYHLVDDGTGGFDKIIQDVEAQMSRGADPLVAWADVYTAAAQGAQAYTDALNAEYDAQYKTISMMTDGDERTKALGDLQKWYNEQVQAGNQAYADAIQKAADLTGALADNGPYADTASGIVAVKDAMEKLAAAGDDQNAQAEALTELQTALDGLDETAVVELTAGLVSMSEAGATMSEGMTSAMEALTGIKELMTGGTDLFGDAYESLSTLFGEGLDQEVLEISATLNTEGLEATYAAWAAGGHADIIPSIDIPEETIDLTGNITSVMAQAGVTFSIDGSGNITDVDWPEGTTFKMDGSGNITSATTADGLTYMLDGSGIITSVTTAAGVTYTVDGSGVVTGVATAYGVTFSVDGSGNITGIATAGGLTFNVDGSGRVTSVTTTDGVTFSVNGTGQITGVTTGDGVTFTLDGTGNITNTLTASGLTFSLDGSGNLTNVTWPETTTFILDGSGYITQAKTADGLTYSLDGSGNITSVTTQEGITFAVDGTGTITSATTQDGTTFTLDGSGVVTSVTTTDGLTFLVDGSGNVTSVTTADGVAYSIDGTANITSLTTSEGLELPTIGVTAEVTDVKFSSATGAGLEALFNRSQEAVNANPLGGTLLSGLSTSISDQTKKAAAELRKFGAEVMTETSTLRGFVQNGTDAANTAQYIATGLQSMQDGTLSPEDAAGFSAFLDNLLTVNDFDPSIMTSIADAMSELDSVEGTALEGINADQLASQLSAAMITLALTMQSSGQDVAAGIGTGMQQYDFSGDAGTTATNIGDAIDTAVGRGSPAELTKPTGEDVSAGLGEGMKQYDFSSDASTVSSSIVSTFGNTSTLLVGVGRNFSSGLAAGILAGRSAVVQAAIGVAKAAAAAARSELQIQSPSRLMEGVGEYFDLGFVEGIRNRMPDISSAVREAVHVTPTAAMYNGTTAPAAAGQQLIDYDRMADAMAQLNMVLQQDGKAYARIQERNNYRESNARARRTALGYGK